MYADRYFWPIIDIFEVCFLSPLVREKEEADSSNLLICLSIVRTTHVC